MQRRLHWFGPDDDLIKGLLLPTVPHTWLRQPGGQLMMWTTTIRAHLGPSLDREFWASHNRLGL